MPVVYVGGQFSVTVTLPDKKLPYKDWIDRKLAAEREKFKKPNLMLWLQIEDKEDPISPLAIPVSDLDLYEGVMKVTQDGMTFHFEFDGKAKVTVHKDTKAAVDAGEKAHATSISVNGRRHPLGEPMDIGLVIQSKKL